MQKARKRIKQRSTRKKQKRSNNKRSRVSGAGVTTDGRAGVTEITPMISRIMTTVILKIIEKESEPRNGKIAIG